mmetsp:Transcript_21816/g.62573  ORF Transcript_21816/g.62573 Transcript_21816/m.62573 type:complete len:260 (-) Transcript_21816:199-978(-)
MHHRDGLRGRLRRAGGIPRTDQGGDAGPFPRRFRGGKHDQRWYRRRWRRIERVCQPAQAERLRARRGAVQRLSQSHPVVHERCVGFAGRRRRRGQGRRAAAAAGGAPRRRQDRAAGRRRDALLERGGAARRPVPRGRAHRLDGGAAQRRHPRPGAAIGLLGRQRRRRGAARREAAGPPQGQGGQRGRRAEGAVRGGREAGCHGREGGGRVQLPPADGGFGRGGGGGQAPGRARIEAQEPRCGEVFQTEQEQRRLPGQCQ